MLLLEEQTEFERPNGSLSALGNLELADDATYV
jgi:hypothetical protein